MWSLLMIPLGFICGVIMSYKYTHSKKIVPLIRFIDKEDKEKVLEEYNIHFNKSTKCSVCGDVITIENIGAVIPGEDGGYIYLCSKPQCMIVSNILKTKVTYHADIHTDTGDHE